MLTHKHHVTLIWNKFRELAAILRVTHIQANILTKARGHIMGLTHAKILVQWTQHTIHVDDVHVH